MKATWPKYRFFKFEHLINQFEIKILYKIMRYQRQTARVLCKFLTKNKCTQTVYTLVN